MFNNNYWTQKCADRTPYKKEIGRKKIIDGLFMGAIYWSRRPRSISASNVALLWSMRNLFSASYSNVVFAYNRCYSLLSISLMPASSFTSLVPGIPKFNKTIGISILLLCELQNYIYWCRYRTQINKPVYQVLCAIRQCWIRPVGISVVMQTTFFYK